MHYTRQVKQKERRKEELRMEYEIEPYVGVGPIRLGMTREEIHTALLEQPELTNKGDAIPADYYRTLGLFVRYRTPGICEFVEMFGPPPTFFTRGPSGFQEPIFLPTFQGRTLLGRPYRQTLAWLRRRDPTTIDEGISLRFGIALYNGSVDGHLNWVESVSIFTRGYYDDIWHLFNGN
jgi:hypothetical protein